MKNLLQYSLKNLKSELQTNLETGLTPEQYKSNLEIYGSNELHKKLSIWKIFVSQFNFFNLLLVGVAVFLFYNGDGFDHYFILAFVVIDILLGSFQEYRGIKTSLFLKKLSQPEALVVRNKLVLKVPFEQLVPGDIINLRAGDLVPADVKIISSKGLFVDERIFSGSKLEISKSEERPETDLNSLYAGSIITKGLATGVVVYTGEKTRSEILNLKEITEEKSSYEKLAEKLSYLIFRLVAISIILVLIGFYFFEEHLILEINDFTKLVIFSITLAVTVIPEALPLIVTFSLSNGALRLFKKKIIVKKLSSIEELGGIEVLCSDKTGTLTENSLKVSEVLNFSDKNLLYYAFLTINESHLSSFDKAILEAYEPRPKLKLLDETPFDAEKKFSNRLVKVRGDNLIVYKGAFEAFQNFNGISKKQSFELLKFNEEQSKQGKRVLLIGKRETTKDKIIEDIENNIKIIGAISFEDEIKFSTFDALNKAKELKIQVKILTGDSKETTFYVAQKLGLCSSVDEVVTGEDLDKLRGETLQKTIEKYQVFCRVSPLQKLKIVQILQKKFTVGFLGEGVNDAEALKQANVGIVVNNSSDVARSQADIILTKKSLEVLIEGIIEGRRIFNNISKYMKISISANFGNFFAMMFAVFFVPFLPLKPIHILLLHFISDIPLLSLAGDRVDLEDLKEPSSEKFSSLIKFMVIIGGISSIFDVIIFSFFRNFGESILQTSWFLASVLTEILIIFSLRTNKIFWKSKNVSPTLGFLSILIVFSTLLLIYTPTLSSFFSLTPLPPNLLAIVIGICVTYFIVTETVKVLLNKKMNEVSRVVSKQSL